MSFRRCTPSANVSVRTRIGRVEVISGGISAPTACSTRFADQGAPPTLRRISTYSIGLAIRYLWILASSHRDSSRRYFVFSANRIRQPSEVVGTVRDHRSTSPRSTGLVGTDGLLVGCIGMKSRSR